ncbi:hypothetical protein F8388_000179 [Cannabis sativa]|uniref:Endonuclease/exonuclease/phosphatase domain-containing protein n=1 Tax=Cannabis sativa TaxID=3483 RepID=A0A7J6F0I5_CANSA|nr:hypothetical protein F8388_000179 [Cannabis sativa]
MGALTIDKYHREPTLFNPICDIEDFRVQEHLDGPRKRKALDGILFSPNSHPVPAQSSATQDMKSPPSAIGVHSNPTPMLSPEEIANVSFSPGATEQPIASSSKRKGKEITRQVNADLGQKKRRGRPPKTQSPLAATPKSFKGGRKTKVSTRGKATSTSQWHDRTFDLKILSDPPGIPWILMGTYGPPNSVEKELFWQKMGDYTLNTTHPVLLLGDMNGTLRDNECFHYHGNTSRYSFDFRRVVDRVGLIDLGFQGPVFTWVKGGNDPRRGGSMKRARLDRGLASTDWRILFPQDEEIDLILGAASFSFSKKDRGHQSFGRPSTEKNTRMESQAPIKCW